jgi:hypothetical protein
LSGDDPAKTSHSQDLSYPVDADCNESPLYFWLILLPMDGSQESMFTISADTMSGALICLFPGKLP